MRSASIASAGGGGLPAAGRRATVLRPGDDGVGFDIVDLVLAQQEADALGELVGGLAAARDHALEVELDFADLDTVLLARAANRFHGFGGIEQRLGRDAAPVEAYAAGQIALDHGHAHFELAGANRRHIAAGAGADYYQVVS